MSLLHTQGVVIVRAGEFTDRYGNTKPDWGTGATRTPVSGVNVQPASSPSSSDEHIDDRQTTVTRWDFFTDRGVDVDLLATDRVEFDGMKLRVDGKVGRWPAPGGGVHHVEATLVEVD